MIRGLLMGWYGRGFLEGEHCGVGILLVEGLSCCAVDGVM